MSVLISESNDFVYAFEKIRNAIALPDESNLHAATEIGLHMIRTHYGTFFAELAATDALADHEYDLETYAHCLSVLQGYFTGNPSGLSDRDARVYSQYLQTEHEGFTVLARELSERG